MVQLLLEAVWAVFILCACSLVGSNPLDPDTSQNRMESPAIAIENTFKEVFDELLESFGPSHSDSSASSSLEEKDVRSRDSVVTRDRLETCDAPDLCQNVPIDSATTTKDGKTYFFKDEFYWEIVNTERIAEGYPRIIAEDWDGLPGCIDASFTWPNGTTMFFKGRKFWRFINKNMEPGYPKLISDRFEGIPDYLDAAFILYSDPNPYFFKGRQYWKYDELARRTFQTYPKDISDFEGLPNYIDAALKASNGYSYVFKDDGYYRIFKDTLRVYTPDNLQPRLSSKSWFGC